MKKKFNGTKGAVTVEACLSFPIFLCFFFTLVFFVKLVCMDLVLEHAANETAKQLAASVYPIKFINELEDDTFLDNSAYGIPSFSEELQKAKSHITKAVGEGASDIFSILVTGEGIQDGKAYNGAGDFLGDLFGSTLNGLKTGVKGYITDKLGNDYYEIKNKAKYTAVRVLTGKFIQGSYVDEDKVEYAMVQLPQSTVEHDRRSRDGAYLSLCSTLGIMPEKDDVVVVLKYKVRIPLPFFNGKVVTLYHVGMEKAWLNGSNGVYSKDLSYGTGNEEATDGEAALEESYRRLGDETVYVTNTGVKYHKSDCPCLTSSRRPMKLSEAEAEGYGKCGVCSNKGKWNFY